MELEPLLREISPDGACGADLEYDPEFMALEQMARGKPEQQFGDTLVPAAEPDWDGVRIQAEALFSRTKDLRVAVLLVRALLKRSNFSGLSAGLELLVKLLERYWDCLYPHLEEDDPTVRLNVLAALVDPDNFLRDLRSAYLIPPGAHGRLTVRDVLVAHGKLQAGSDGALDIGQVEGILRATADLHSSSIEAARQSFSAVRQLKALLVEKLGAEQALDLRALLDTLELVVRTCDKAVGAPSGGLEADAAGEGTSSVTLQTPAHGEVRSREDANRILDRVCEFIERTEPSNPAPLLIRRAQRLISKNFIEIIEDLAPDSLGAIRSIAGLERE